MEYAHLHRLSRPHVLEAQIPKTTKKNLIKSYYFDTTTTVRKRSSPMVLFSPFGPQWSRETMPDILFLVAFFRFLMDRWSANGAVPAS